MWIIVIIGAVFVFGPDPTTAQCNYQQSVVPGVSYQIYSPGYNGFYASGLSCSWQATAPVGYTLKLSCPDVVIPQSANCAYDRLTVNVYGYVDAATDNAYCMTGSLEIASYANALNVRLRTYSTGGRFYCTLTTVVDVCGCGRRKTSARIVGGTQSIVNEFPYQAMLTRSGTSFFLICSASIISVRHALTAAHCVVSETTSSIVLRVGEHDIASTSESPYMAVYSLSAIRSHSAFDGATSNNDVAIVVTASEIQLNLGVGLVCLPFRQANAGALLAGATVTVTGWGSVEFGAGDSKVLLKTNVNVLPNSGTCGSTYPAAASNNNFMCTYAANKDTCQRDSGTNLYYQDSGRIYSVGVTSGGKGGCASGYPTLNMRTTAYLNWILSQSSGVTFCAA